MQSHRMAWILSLFLLLLFAIPGKAQTANPNPRSQGASGSIPVSDASENQERQVHDLAKKANQARQVLLKADTDKLLKLAVELKDSVDKSNENVLSLDVLKKAEEIEKLAHSVKDKMKGPN
jgi:hypothetical protein